MILEMATVAEEMAEMILLLIAVRSLRTRTIPEHLRGVFTTRRYTNPHLPLPLP